LLYVPIINIDDRRRTIRYKPLEISRSSEIVEDIPNGLIFIHICLRPKVSNRPSLVLMFWIYDCAVFTMLPNVLE